jgi:hypothetical protein
MHPSKTAVIGVALIGFIATAGAAGERQNTTGLPTYPRDASGIMDATFRSLPNGQHCISYVSSTGDSLSTVEDWYKKQLPNAKIDDINLYADTERNKATIELYKCRDAAKPGN